MRAPLRPAVIFPGGLYFCAEPRCTNGLRVIRRGDFVCVVRRFCAMHSDADDVIALLFPTAEAEREFRIFPSGVCA